MAQHNDCPLKYKLVYRPGRPNNYVAIQRKWRLDFLKNIHISSNILLSCNCRTYQAFAPLQEDLVVVHFFFISPVHLHGQHAIERKL